MSRIIHILTFADSNMSRAAQLCVESALHHGAQFARLWSKEDYETFPICKDFPKVFVQPSDPRRSWGWWAWKADIIRGAMESENTSDDDIVIYADAGVEFINSVSHIIDRMGHDKPQDDIWLFGNNWEHAHWCKADVIGAAWDEAVAWGTVGAPIDWARFRKQVQASVIFLRVSHYSRRFIQEWLQLCLAKAVREGRGERYLIDDSESFLANHPEFRENRHDQAILTTLAYREGIKLHWWPAVYLPNDRVYDKLPEYAGDTYGPLFRHHRRRNVDWEQAA